MSVPKLRFEEFQNSWKIFRLEEIASVERGKFSVRPRNDPKYFGGHLPFIQTGDVSNANIFVKNYSQTLNYAGIEVSRVFPEGTILITIAANIGDTAITQFQVACPDSLVGINPNTNITNTYFLKYVLDLSKETLDSQATQNAQKNINLQILRPLPCCLPVLEEQTKIATFLFAVDEKIAQLSRKHELLQQYKQGMIQQLFSQKLRFKDDKGEDFPEWEMIKLGEFLIQYTEKSIYHNQYPVLTSSRSGIFFQKDYFAGQDIASEDTTGYNVVPYDYFTYRHMSDDLTFKFNINNLCDYGIVSTLYPVFTINKKRLNNYFLQVILNNGTEFKSFAMLQKQGGSRTYMYFSKLVNLNLTVPSLDEQAKITNFLTAIDNKIDTITKQLQQAREWKQGLLQQMFV